MFLSYYYYFLLVLLVLRTIQTRWSRLGESIGTDKIVNSCANYCKLITSVNFYTLYLSHGISENQLAEPFTMFLPFFHTRF